VDIGRPNRRASSSSLIKPFDASAPTPVTEPDPTPSLNTPEHDGSGTIIIIGVRESEQPFECLAQPPSSALSSLLFAICPQPAAALDAK